MLDDQAYIARFDSKNALAVAAGTPKQLIYKDFDLNGIKKSSPANVVITGMGGSALGGLLVRDWLDDEIGVPLVITRDYTLPKFVNKNSVVIVSSYSGNTEETISALKDAESKGAQIVVITDGGELAKLAKVKGHPLLLIPEGYQPRMAANFGIKLLASTFLALGLIKDKSAELEAAYKFLDQTSQSYLPQVQTPSNLAKKIALEVAGKTAIIYSGPVLASAGYKWKIDCNENAKNLAWCNQLPEFDHNELIGWSGKPPTKPFAVINLKSSFDGPKINKRFELSARLLSGQMPSPIEVMSEGKTKLEQILWAVQLGDFMSMYLAILNQINPTSVDLLDKFKSQL